MPSLRAFIDTHYRHFNAAALREAAIGYCRLLEQGGSMFMTLAGAMSTAELGVSLAKMIRQGKVAGISCTGANLEEDLFNAVAHDRYMRLPNYRDLTPEQERELGRKGMNRVTDTCIPEDEAMRVIERLILPLWQEEDEANQACFPHEYVFKAVLQPEFRKLMRIPPEHSWVLAAAEANLPLVVPGWEDSTLSNFYSSHRMRGKIRRQIMRHGVEYQEQLARWYSTNARQRPIGFFQIGGGIAGDFPICIVPLLNKDLREGVPVWRYFCQITDAQESYGGYSGALPTEKITWGKLEPETPKYVIHSDATIVAPLIFAYVLDE
ncbi:MAG: deoxyhypusine synthase family protein [Nevskia sp.]|nr:deoxyhypusine synthase family protein [Nevskia sp.]